MAKQKSLSSSVIGFSTLLYCLFQSPGSSFAINTIVPPLDREVTFSGAQNLDNVDFLVTSQRSYCCTLYQPLDATVSFYRFGADSFVTSAKNRGLDAPGLAFASGEAAQQRKCWKEDILSNPIPRTGYFEGFAAPANVQILCNETTLRGNFNTSVSEFNFIEITAFPSSTFSPAIDGKVILYRTVTPGTLEIPFKISFNGLKPVRSDISVHDALSGQQDFGQVVVLHDASPGQIRARVSQYDITSTSPLNFTLVGQSELSMGSGR